MSDFKRPNFHAYCQGEIVNLEQECDTLRQRVVRLEAEIAGWKAQADHCKSTHIEVMEFINRRFHAAEDKMKELESLRQTSAEMIANYQERVAKAETGLSCKLHGIPKKCLECAEAKGKELRECLDHFVHLCHGINKGGESPIDSDWHQACEDAEKALAPEATGEKGVQ